VFSSTATAQVPLPALLISRSLTVSAPAISQHAASACHGFSACCHQVQRSGSAATDSTVARLERTNALQQEQQQQGRHGKEQQQGQKQREQQQQPGICRKVPGQAWPQVCAWLQLKQKALGQHILPNAAPHIS
jgi:hypothetical protein